MLSTIFFQGCFDAILKETFAKSSIAIPIPVICGIIQVPIHAHIHIPSMFMCYVFIYERWASLLVLPPRVWKSLGHPPTSFLVDLEGFGLLWAELWASLLVLPSSLWKSLGHPLTSSLGDFKGFVGLLWAELWASLLVLPPSARKSLGHQNNLSHYGQGRLLVRCRLWPVIERRFKTKMLVNLVLAF